MSTLASLNIQIGGNSATLRKELTKAGKSVSSFAKNARSSMNTYGKAGVLAGGLVVGALLGIYKQQAAAIDQTAKFADNIGIQTSALTELRHASALSGVANKDLDKSLENMTRRTADAAFKGTGPLADTLKALQINAQDLNKLKPDEQLGVMADALSGIESQSERTRIAYELFGKSGIGMLKLMEGGSESIDSMRESAVELGLSLNRIDANKVEIANDAVTGAESVWSSFSQNLAIEAAPVIGSLADLFLENAKQAGGMGSYAADAVGTMVKGAGFVGDAWRGIQVIWQALKVSFNGLRVLVMEGANAMLSGMTSLGQHIIKTVVWPLQKALDAAGYFNDDAAKMAQSLASLSNFEAPQLFDKDETAAAYKSAQESTTALHNLMMEPIPSQNLDDWYAKAKEKYEELAKNYVGREAPEPIVLPDVVTDTGTEEKKNPFESQIAAAQEYLQLKKTMEENAWTEEQARLNLNLVEYGEALSEKLIKDQEYHALVSQAHSEFLDAKAAQDQAHQNSEKLRQVAQLQGASQLFNGLYGITEQFAGRQSGLYKAMFIASKAFSVAESIVKIQQGIANAAARDYPENLFAMGSVIAATSSIVSTIQGTEIEGMAHDGIDYIPQEGTWLLNKGERVVDDRTNADLKNYLASSAGKSTNQSANKTEVSFNLQNITDSSLIGMIKANKNMIARILKDSLERPA